MNKILKFYDKYHFVINTIFVLIILGLLTSITILNITNKKEVVSPIETEEIDQIVLFGNTQIELREGEEYIEPGFYAVTKKGEIKKSEIKVNSNLDIDKAGVYSIDYEIGNKKVTRTIKVLEKETSLSDITFNLKGDAMVVLAKGEDYIEPGFIATSKDNKDLSEKVTIKGEVLNDTIGTYEITYTLQLNNTDSQTLKRQVIVKETLVDATIVSDKTEFTNSSVILKIEATGDNFSFVRNPDSTYTSSKISHYEVSKNGTYKFYIYDTKGNYLLKEYKVTNIDKDIPTGVCEISHENGNTFVNVSALDATSQIQKYAFYTNNTLVNEGPTNTYTTSGILNNFSVIIYDKALNSKQINCSSKNQYGLEVHFINVGREDAIVIRDDTKTIFIDGGSYNKGDKIVKYLKDLGVTKIDALIGSHLHYNHIQAQAKLLENFEVTNIYYPQDLNTCYSTYCDKNDQKYILDAIKKYNKKITIMKVDDNIKIGNMDIFCIGPIKFQTKSQNKYRQNYNSSNFILTYGNTKFLFTGDNVQYSEILKRFDKGVLDIDVLKYPHHGNASLGKTFVNTITPRYVVLTSASDELKSRSEKTYLKNVGASFYYSYKDGNILITSDGNNLEVKREVKALDYKR